MCNCKKYGLSDVNSDNALKTSVPKPRSKDERWANALQFIGSVAQAGSMAFTSRNAQAAPASRMPEFPIQVGYVPDYGTTYADVERTSGNSGLLIGLGVLVVGGLLYKTLN